MVGSLVTWLQEESYLKNICIIVKCYDRNESNDSLMFLVYDMATREYFYALEEELYFI